MVAGDWRPSVPAATIGAPARAGFVLSRPALLHRLTATTPGDLIVVTAPAGYGKTTAAQLWDEADGRPFAWLRLDVLDADPAHLVLHLASALDQVVSIGAATLRYLRGAGRDPVSQLVPALVRALEQQQVVIVLDDVHTLTAEDAVHTLQSFVAHLPASVSVVLLGRSTPPVELARRRLQRNVSELGPAELKFSEPEAAAVLHAVGDADEPTVRAVVERCEGWPAGVMLAALALRDGAAAVGFTGRNRLVADYLVEEVLAQLDPDTLKFLTESALLDRFCARSLDTILGRSDSRLMLDRALRSVNGFLVALDDERRWYRYHHLFGDLLRARLRDDDPERFREVSLRAADALAEAGDVDEALQQVLAAGDRARAAALVGAEAVVLGFDGRAGVLARRIAMLDDRTLAEYPDAAIANAWLGVTAGDAALIQRSLLAATRADRGQPLADGTPSVKVAVALVNSLVGVRGLRDVAHSAEQVRAAGNYTVNRWWGAATVMYGAAAAMRGEPRVARAALESALPATTNLPGFHAAALAHLALLDLAEGDDAGARQRSASARAIADEHDLCDLVPMVVVYATSAVLAARSGDEDRARAAVAITERLLGGLGFLAARTALLGHGLLAWTAAVLRDEDLLSEHLDAADRAARREPDARALAQRIERVRAMANTGQRPLSAAELRLLPYLATHLSLQRIADALMIGRETAKSQTASIYRKFGVSSRTAAVAEGKRIGLIPR